MKDIIRTRSDASVELQVSKISSEIRDFNAVIIEKYSSIDFEFDFCFRVLYTTEGIKSKARFYKIDNWLGLDLIMPQSEFMPYKENAPMQRKIIGKYFFPFFAENIKKYSKKLPTLKPIADNLIEDMRLFLIEKEWIDSMK